MVVIVRSCFIPVQPNGHSMWKEVLHIEKNWLCWQKDQVKYCSLVKEFNIWDLLWMSNQVFVGNGRVNQVNWLNLSELAAAPTKPKTNLTNRVSLFEAQRGPKYCVCSQRWNYACSGIWATVAKTHCLLAVWEAGLAIYSHKAVFWK